MIVTCPNCSTKYNLPDEKVTADMQMRCTLCKTVFSPPHQAKQAVSLDLGGLPKPKRSSAKIILFILAILIISLASGAAYLWLARPDVITTYLPQLKKEKAKPTQDMISLITLRGVRQYSIVNEKIGNISVIEGKALNSFKEPRELIRLEASLFDKDGKLLVTKQQLAGTQVSLFQLQILGEQELEQALNNKIDILSNNTNVQSGTEVPFMLVFYKPSENAAEFGVKVIDAKNPPPLK